MIPEAPNIPTITVDVPPQMEVHTAQKPSTSQHGFLSPALPSSTPPSASNDTTVAPPPSPTLSTRSFVHFHMSLALRDNAPETTTGMTSLALDKSPRSNVRKRLVHVYDCGSQSMKWGERMDGGEDNRRIQLEQDVEVDPAPFPIKAYRLAQLVDPKIFDTLESLGGTSALLKGLNKNVPCGFRHEKQRHPVSRDSSNEKAEAEEGPIADSAFVERPCSPDSEPTSDNAESCLQKISKGFRRIFHSGQSVNMFESKLDSGNKKTKSPRCRDVKIIINAQRNCGNTTSNSHNDSSRTDVNAGNTHNTNHGSGSFEYVAGGNHPPEQASWNAGSSPYAPCAYPDTPHYQYWINYVWSWVPCFAWDGWFSRFNGWMLQLLPQIMWG